MKKNALICCMLLFGVGQLFSQSSPFISLLLTIEYNVSADSYVTIPIKAYVFEEYTLLQFSTRTTPFNKITFIGSERFYQASAEKVFKEPSYFEYVLFDNFDQRKVVYVPFLGTAHKDTAMVVDSSEHYIFSNLAVGNFIAKVPKKIVFEKQIVNTLTCHYYIPKARKTDILPDSVTLFFDKSLETGSFSFSKILEEQYKSKLRRINVTVLERPVNQKQNKKFKRSYIYTLSNNTAYNPAKIDSIFAKLIPLLPKK